VQTGALFRDGKGNNPVQTFIFSKGSHVERPGDSRGLSPFIG